MLIASDGAILGYHVPAQRINGEDITNELTSLIENLPPLSPSIQKKKK
jgi:hypothetical protein